MKLYIILLFSIFNGYCQNVDPFQLQPNVLDGKENQLKLYIDELYGSKKSNLQNPAVQSLRTQIPEDVARMADRLIEAAYQEEPRAKKAPPSASNNNETPQAQWGTGTSNTPLTILFFKCQDFIHKVYDQLTALSQRSACPLAISDPYDLNWCPCFSPQERIFFIIQLVKDIEKNFPRKEELLIYTSVASGGLLQDYLTVSELFQAGYKNIEINIIDLDYPDVNMLPKTPTERATKYQKIKETNPLVKARLNGGKTPSTSTAKELTEKEKFYMLENTLRIENFELHLGQLLSRYQFSRYFLVHYNNAQDYLARCENNSSLKSNVLVMVDPDRPALFQLIAQGAFPYLINTMKIKKPQDASQNIYLIFSKNPHNKSVHMYYTPDIDDTFKQAVKNILLENKFIISKILLDLKNHYPGATLYYSSAHAVFEDVAVHATQPGALAYIAADLKVYVDDTRRRIRKLDINAFNSADFIQETIVKDLQTDKNYVKEDLSEPLGHLQ